MLSKTSLAYDSFDQKKREKNTYMNQHTSIKASVDRRNADKARAYSEPTISLIAFNILKATRINCMLMLAKTFKNLIIGFFEAPFSF